MLFQGCTSYHAYDSGRSEELEAEINEMAENNYADITLSSNDKFLVKDLLFTADTTYFFHVDEERGMGISNADINNILIVDRPKGAFKGLFLGGAIIGLMLGLYAMEISRRYDLPFEGLHVYGAAASGAIIGGLIIGVPAGWIVGVRDKYEIKQPEK
jgi:hypothetical protein